MEEGAHISNTTVINVMAREDALRRLHYIECVLTGKSGAIFAAVPEERPIPTLPAHIEDVAHVTVWSTNYAPIAIMENVPIATEQEKDKIKKKNT